MKTTTSKIIRLWIVLISILTIQAGRAQIVTVNLNILPPYSPFYHDYAGFSTNYLNTGNTIVTLLSTANTQVYLTATIKKDDNSIGIEVKDSYRPGIPVNLMANIPQTLVGLQLKNIYGNGNSNDLILTGLTTNELMYNQALPEGNYTVCVQARDYVTGVIVGEDCKDIFIAYYEPPQITYPNDFLPVYAQNPQYILATWSPVTPFLADVKYRVRVVKMLPGVSATDALKNATQVILDKPYLINTMLDIASGVILDTGSIYAMQVTASSALAYFKNNGESEPVVFHYRGSPYLIPGANGITLNFIRPSAAQDYIETNNETPFLINWNWFDKEVITDTLFINDTAYKKYGVVQYKLSIENTDKPIKGNQAVIPLKYRKTIHLVGNKLQSYVTLSEKAADSIGFKHLNWYKASVEAYDAGSNKIATAKSVDFQYRNIKDEEPGMDVSVNAMIKYMFNDSSGALFNASNAPFEIRVLKKLNSPVAAYPTTMINNVSYITLKNKAGTTDAIGAVHDTVSIPLKTIMGDSIYLQLQLSGEYYIDKNFPVYAVKGVDRDTSINFGQLVAQTYGYSLKLFVKKAYTRYKINNSNGAMDVALADSVFDSDAYDYEYSSENGGTMTYAVESKTLAENVTMVLYRKNKQGYIPPIEGKIADYSHTSGFTEIARGVTQIEKGDSGDVTFVKFDRLLSWVFTGDEYYIIALNGKNYTDKPTGTNQYQINPNITIQNDDVLTLQNHNNATLPNQNNLVINNVQNNTGVSGQYNFSTIWQPDWNNAFNPFEGMTSFDDGFIAEEMLFKLDLPLNIDKPDSLYRHVTANYDIVSNKPPTSLVSGKILYHWKSDGGNQLRPYANQNFKVVVDYLVDGKPIGKIKSISGNSGGFSFSELFFVPEGQEDFTDGMELLDFDKTMAVGKTDAQGNFEIEVVNLNEKGDLGPGTLAENGWHFDYNEETEPDWGLPEPGDNWLDDIFGNDGFGVDDFLGDDFLGDDWGIPGSSGLQIFDHTNQGIQNTLNNDMPINFNTAGGYFNVENAFNEDLNQGGIFIPGGNGPRPLKNYVMLPKKAPQDGKPVSKFERVYRIVPDNQYIYPCKETFAVDAFEAKNLDVNQTAYVKEIRLRVHTMEKTNNLPGMLVTIFRNIDDKTKDMPLGEGNGEYKYTTLINPQLTTGGNTANMNNAQSLNTGSNIYTEKFELLWEPKKVSETGWVEFTALLAGFDKYYIEAVSDPLGQYTYKATFDKVDTYIDDNNPAYWLGDEEPDAKIKTIKLDPLPSRALIRLIDNSTQKSISGNYGGQGGKVAIKSDESFLALSKAADADGYVEFIADQFPMSIFSSPVKFEGSAKGYNKIKDTAAFTYAPTGYQFFYNYLLDPAMRMKGHIVNMDANPRTGVPSYIKVEGGKVIETGSDGRFSDLPVPGVTNTKILIIPKDVGFFDSTYTVNLFNVLLSTVDLGDFGVYRRKHRIKFIISDNSNHVLANASVQLGDTVKKTSFLGTAYYKFENVSVNNFTFVIRGPEGQNFIPKTLNLPNVESKTYVTKEVKLETGSEVHGKVTLDGKPVKNAKVYIDVAQQTFSFPPFNNALNNDANLVVAYSDKNGNYTLRGVPVNNQIIYLHATLDTSFTVSGDLQKADIKNHTATTNLALTSFKGMLVNNIYGFPLTVEKITVMKPDSSEIKVTGVVHWSKAISNFDLEETNQVLRIENVNYKSTLVNGKKVGVPQDASVAIEGISNLKFRYLDKYNVKLRATQGSGYYDLLNPDPLVISKENDLGVIKGKVSIVDNSFNYPSTYLNFSGAVNNFYLAEKVNETSVNTFISAVTSAMTETQTNNNYYPNFNLFIGDVQNHMYNYGQQPKPLYYLSNKSGDSIRFKLIEFEATANPANSYIDVKGKIHLDVNLKCHIDNAQPPNFRLKIGNMVLDNNTVDPVSSNTPITLALEKWTMIVKNWSFSTQEGGIVSTNGLINTKAIDIPFSKFVLRHDLFLMDEFKLDKLTMAGGNIALENIVTTNAAIVYDNKTGTDMLPHWRFSISGNPAAELPKFDDLDKKIKLNYIQITSNNESVFQLQQQGSPYIIRTNSLAQYTPESIYNGPDYISVSGGLHIGAPRMGDIPLRLSFKNKSSMKLLNVEVDFEGQGFVHFVSRDSGNNVPNITISPTEITILGDVMEKPVETFNKIPATFYANVNKLPFYNVPNTVTYKVEMKKGFETQLNQKDVKPFKPEGSKLFIQNGGMSVTGNDWSILNYEGMMSSNSDPKTKPTKVKYAVMGDISANADSLSVSNIKTPFGDLKMVFDFAHKRMIGSITAKNIPLGGTIITGTVETLFDPDGFYVAGGCNAKVKLPSIVDGTYNMGFMVGSYPITVPLWDVVNSYKNPAVKNDCYKATVENKLSGFYFTLDRVIIDFSLEKDFILAKGYVQANALFGADVWMNISPFATGAQAHVYAHAAAGLGSITGTSISGEFSTLGALLFEYAESTFTAKGTLDMGFKATISQSLVLTTISESIDINCHAKAGTDGFDFSFGSGDAKADCK